MGIVFDLKRPTYSPLGSREALKNVDKDSPGLFICADLVATSITCHVGWNSRLYTIYVRYTAHISTRYHVIDLQVGIFCHFYAI